MSEKFGTITTTPINPNAFSGGGNGQDVDEKLKPINNKISDIETTLQYILDIIQSGDLDTQTVNEIEQLIVSYLENKTIMEVEQ